MVFYRKYRPQTFAQLIGQDHVAQALAQAIANNTIGHAYLFAGPKGSGKTSTARILAKAVNCEKITTLHIPNTTSEQVNPCNECSSCIAITDGTHMDVLEIDAASNRGIDDIRALQEKIMLSPVQGRKKVYIIDEVHMLTNEAFNALLKTLEEPPSHVLIVLATTEVHKVPQTILSRCQRFTFRLATHDELRQALQTIIDAEHITIAEAALDLLITRAEGSYRDAEKMLDQLAASRTEITEEAIGTVFHASYAQQAEQFLSFLAAGDITQAVGQGAGIAEQGSNVHEFLLAVLQTLRTISYMTLGIATETQQTPALTELAKNLPKQKLFLLVKLLAQAEREMRFTSLVTVPLEVALFDWYLQMNSSESTVSTHVAIQKPKAVPVVEKVAPPAVIKQPQPVIEPLEAGAMIAEASDNIEQAVVTAETVAPEVAAEPVIDATDAAIATPGTASDGSLKTIQQQWPAIIRQAVETNPSIALLLKNAAIHQVADDVVTLEVFYKFHKERLENDRNRRLAESVIAEVLGKPMQVKCVFFQKRQKAQETIESEDLGDLASQIFSAE